MATSNNNVKNVKFLRNGSLYGTREAAVSALSGFTLDANSDGTLILARYGSGSNVKTVAGLVYYGNDGNHSVTVIDVEGSSSDVSELRAEINAKLGEGITSANTATDQFIALSGLTGDSSGVTSVNGAKAYARDYTNEAIGELEYTGVTTGANVYVSNVTETDGVISATTRTLEAENVGVTGFTATNVQGALEEVKDDITAEIQKLDGGVTAASGSYVASVTETDGIISGTTAELPSVTDTAQAKKVVIAVSEDKGEIEVSRGSITSSGETILLGDNADGGVNFEVNYDGTTIIQDPDTKALKVASSALIQYVGDEDTIHISEVVGDSKTVSSPLTIQKVTTGLSEEVKEEYRLVGASGTTIGEPVKIYKDSHIVSIDYSGSTQKLYYTYLDVSGQTKTTEVDMSELVLEQEFASGITVSDHIAHGVVDPASETFLTVGAAGFKLSGVQDAIDDAIDALDADESGSTTHVTVGVKEVDGVISSVTVSENDIASEAKLNELSAKTFTVATSANNSISTATSTASDGTVSVDLTTDASKIKMTGFTAAQSGFTDITTASTVTEAVKAIETAFLDNEEVIAGALTELDGRVDAIESGFVETVKVNNVALAETDNAVNVQISGSTSASTASTTEAIVVTTDPSTGAITLGLASIDCGTY